ncbi:hypothetical protein EVAR_94422_1 [Eumeta japonica]|uniref:Histone deacetylase glutamine rich N-terminal domain-containing protein n=1 Tax=Eumeta variegata TaxID=151549 RepID=A0A4C1TQ53_EUMVA|nr:hypothetical protein EVAR_94422_1 [Eumeta japonica]
MAHEGSGGAEGSPQQTPSPPHAPVARLPPDTSFHHQILQMCGGARKDRCRNSDVRERCGLREDVVTRVERGMLRWFSHLERMNESRLTRQIYRADVCDGKTADRLIVPSVAEPVHSGQRLKQDEDRGAPTGCRFDKEARYKVSACALPALYSVLFKLRSGVDLETSLRLMPVSRPRRRPPRKTSVRDVIPGPAHSALEKTTTRTQTRSARTQNTHAQLATRTRAHPTTSHAIFVSEITHAHPPKLPHFDAGVMYLFTDRPQIFRGRRVRLTIVTFQLKKQQQLQQQILLRHFQEQQQQLAEQHAQQLQQHLEVSLFREPLSAHALGRRHRRTPLTQIFSHISAITFELVKLVINSRQGMEFRHERLTEMAEKIKILVRIVFRNCFKTRTRSRMTSRFSPPAGRGASIRSPLARAHAHSFG